jgi:hypothetical protein
MDIRSSILSTKSILVQGGDGTAIPAGMVGEKITWTTPPSGQTVTTVETDWTNAFITLTPGTWLVVATLSAIAKIGSGQAAGSYSAIRMKITDSSNNIVDGQYKTMDQFCYAASTAEAGIEVTTPFIFIKSVTSSTILKIRVLGDRTGGGNPGAINNTASVPSEFYAVRIAGG